MKGKIALIVLIALAALFLIVFLILRSGHKAPLDLSKSIPTEIPGQVVYVAFPVTIKVDGQLSDWSGIPINTVNTGSRPSTDPAEDGSFSFQVAADKDNLYINMQAVDKNIVAGKHGTDFWNEDSLEFYVNASDDLNAKTYGPKIFQININAEDIGNTNPDGLTITGVNSSDYKLRGFVFKTENGWGFEAALPLKGLLTPSHGLEVGFQAQLNGASTLDRDVKLIWSKSDTTDGSWQYPRLFGRAIFFQIGRTDIPQSSQVLAMATDTLIPSPTPVIIPAQISVNQTGYFPTGEKIASLAMESVNPTDWSLLNNKGEVVQSGKTIIKGLDAASGDFIQIIDFSTYQAEGSGYRISAAGLESVPFSISGDIYGGLKKDAMAYFYNNRSGIPIETKFVGEALARLAGHLSDKSVTCYKGTDADGKTWPGCSYSLDVSGGWYDAGDFGKYVVNGGISAWTMMNLYERFPNAFPDGSLKIPEQNNGISDLLDEARWEMEFLLSMQVPQGQPQAGMAFHKIHDLAWAPIPMVPPTQVDNNSDFSKIGIGRYLYPPSTAATLNLAATGAQCARIWKSIDNPFSERCLKAAEIAWQAALDNPNLFAGNTPGTGGGNYDDKVVSDEFYWAAAELFLTTGNEAYGSYLLSSDQFGMLDSFDWGHTSSLGNMALVMTSNNLPVDRLAILKEKIISFADQMIATQKIEGYSVPLIGDYPWGSNGQILNNMILMGVAYDVSADGKYLDAMRLGMDYILGRNPLNISYVSGYGTYSMQHPHHRFWANDPANGFPAPPSGALAGGPNSNPADSVAVNANLIASAPSRRYLDEMGSFTTNEVAINWNASLVWVATFLDQVSK